MEESDEGHSDSDVSDGWSFVDYKSEDTLKNSSDSGIPADPVVSNREDLANGLDECFELTELSQPEEDPLGVLASLQNNQSRDHDTPSHMSERHLGYNGRLFLRKHDGDFSVFKGFETQRDRETTFAISLPVPR